MKKFAASLSVMLLIGGVGIAGVVTITTSLTRWRKTPLMHL